MRRMWLSGCVLMVVSTSVMATVLDNIGFTRLRAELGETLPTGDGLRVTQVESPAASDHDDNPLTQKIRTWRPDTTARGLASKKIVVHAATPAVAYSRHATKMARLLIGPPGMATASTLEVRVVSDWIGEGGLRAFSRLEPQPSTSRVFSHSWAATLGGGDSRILRRVDWLAHREDVIQVVGVRNASNKVNQPLLAGAYNVIVVGRSDANHSRGTPRVDSTYVEGRTRPHIVVPQKSASAATPVVASATLLLAEVSQTPSLSTSGIAEVTRGGLELYDAGRAEVLRAVLMASADRSAKNIGYADISDYRDAPGSSTENGLDRRYGAGQLNVYKAWNLLSAGEQEPSSSTGDTVATTGFDYMPALKAGPAGHPATVSYELELDVAGEFNATLSWHLLFAEGFGNRFDASAVLTDLDLCLYRLQDGRKRLLAASNGTDDTTENLHVAVSPGLYHLEVRGGAGEGDRVRQDYGLAWQFIPAGAD